MSGQGIATALAAAAPGIAQGAGQIVDSYKGFQADKALDASTAQQTGGAPVGLADANHPVWSVLSNLTGNPGNAPLPGGGTPAPAAPAIPQMAAPMAPAASPVAPTNVSGMQNGGVVRLNNGSPVVAPSFEKGPALPTGPNNTVTAPTSPTAQGVAGYANGGVVGDTAMGQGITPASTEGQILSFDAGGVVPDGFHEQQGISGVPMSGRGAALVEGIQAGQNIGHNLQQAWHDHAARESAAQYAGTVAGVDVNNPNSGQSPEGSDWLGKAKDAVEGFFHHMNNVSLDDNHKPIGAQAVPSPDASAPPAGGPALPAGGSPVPPGAPAGGGPAPAAAAPAGAAPTPPPGANPAASPVPSGGGPAQPAQPQPGGSPPVAGAPPQQPTPQQQATQIAAKTVAGNNEVRQGVPDKTPEQSQLPHSMTPDQWQHMNMLKQKAVMAAARAGEDPAKVYESLTAMQNAHFQGQILKQLGTANVAFQNGDMKSVEQALKNVNYYLPNGQDIQFKKADANDAAADPSVKPGDLMYKNPFYGMYGHEKDPEYTKVDQQHIQSLGAAALDPRTVQEAQLKAYAVQNEAQSNRIKAQGEADTGLGRKFTGVAAVQNAGTRAGMIDVDRRLKIAAGNKDQAEANWYNTRQPGGANNGQPKVTTANIIAMQKDVADTTNRLAQGLPTTAPVTNPDGTPNISPGAGKSIPDATRIPNYLKGITPEQHENIVTLGGQVKAANPAMPTSEAIEIGARITHYQTSPTTHINAQGKKEKDFVYDSNNGTAHVWVGNGWKNVYLKPNVADGPEGNEAPPTGGNSAGLASGEEASSGPDAFQ